MFRLIRTSKRVIYETETNQTECLPRNQTLRGLSGRLEIHSNSDRRRLHPAVRFRLVALLHSARRSLGRDYIRRQSIAVHVFKSQQTERLALSQTRRGDRWLEKLAPTNR